MFPHSIVISHSSTKHPDHSLTYYNIYSSHISKICSPRECLLFPPVDRAHAKDLVVVTVSPFADPYQPEHIYVRRSTFEFIRDCTLEIILFFVGFRPRFFQSRISWKQVELGTNQSWTWKRLWNNTVWTLHTSVFFKNTCTLKKHKIFMHFPFRLSSSSLMVPKEAS